jgi:prophage antirepressor-like protein
VENTMADLSLFDFNGNSVRSFLIGETIWFIAKDVCDILEIKNVADALSRLDEDEKSTIVLNDGTPGNPNTATISEEGFYSLALSSRKPQAKPFRKWVTSEVLPSIRKTGSYTAPTQRQLPKPMTIGDYVEACRIMGFENDPIIRPLLSQRMAEELGGKSLPATRQILVAVRAGELGISQKDIGTGSQLGKYIVACGFEPNGKTPHGRYEVNTFSPSPELDEAILRFFE